MADKFFYILTALCLALLNPITSIAECFPLKSSKGGADLYLIGSQATVRIERNGGGYDVGIKVDSGLSQNSKRLEVKEDESAELVGEQLAENGKLAEVVKVYLSMGQLVIIAKGKALIRDLTDFDENATCIPVRTNADYFINQAIKNTTTKAVRLQVNSANQIAAALGL